MASRKLSKQNMREDQVRDFLSEMYFGSLRHLEANWRSYTVGFALVVALTAGGLYLMQRWEKAGQLASYQLSGIMDAYDAPTGPDAKPRGLDAPTFANREARNRDVEKRVAEMAGFGASTGTKDAGKLYNALALADAGKSAEALAAVTPLTKGSPLAPLALTLRARLYEAQGQFDKAEADWKALSTFQSPSIPKGEGLWELGQFYERRKENAKALEAYNKIEAVLPAAKDGDTPQSEDPLTRRAKARIDALKGNV